MKITAAQHVSAMLTSRQSPTGQAGYQTLSYTRERLTPDELRVIEQRVQYGAARDSQVKWQSYRLNDRQHVISRVVPIHEPDDFGRRGRYFTHSLIYDLPDGQQFDAALIGLARAHGFFSSLGQVLASEEAKTGRAPSVTVDDRGARPGGGPARLRDWSGEQLNRLYVLMSNPRELIEQGGHVALIGDESQILDALEVALLLAPPDERKFCSFDTNAPGDGAPPGLTFWGRGSEAAAGTSYVIDAARRRVAVPDSSSLWTDRLATERLSAPLRQAVVAQLGRPSEEMLRCLANRRYAAFVGEPLYRALLGEAGLPLTPSDVELLAPFGRAHGGLGLLLALKSGDDAQRLRRLAALDSQSYTERCEQLGASSDFEPWQVFSPTFMYTWFRLFRGVYRLDDLTIAITKVAEHGSEQEREYVEDIHEHLHPDERRALGRWLQASTLRLERLQAALDSPSCGGADGNHEGKVRSFLRRVRHPFGG